MSISDLLLKAILGTLTAEEAEQLRAWREADPANEQLYRQTTDIDFLKREYRRFDAVRPERPLAAMQERIGQERSSQEHIGQTPTVRRKSLWQRVAAIAAVGAIGIGIGALLTTYLGGEHTANRLASATIQAGQQRAILQMLDSEGNTLSTRQLDESTILSPSAYKTTEAPSGAVKGASTATETLALTTPRGGEFRIVLEDGTEVWLNAQSRLIYPETFGSHERRVQVEGEAYFRVARDEQKPFLVETDGQLVHVLGTEFNVRSYPEDATVLTTLVSGAIGMQPIGAGQAQLQLTPGHQAVFDKAGHHINVRSVDTDVVTSWKDGKFVFENQTLEQIMRTLSRWYDFDYHFADGHAAQTEFMGSIPRYSDFADVVAILEGSGGLRISIKGKEVTIASKHN